MSSVVLCVVLSAIAAKNRVENAHGGPERRLPQGALSESTFCNENEPTTRATSRVACERTRIEILHYMLLVLRTALRITVELTIVNCRL